MPIAVEPTGSFTQTGGTNTAIRALYLDHNADSSGSYNLSSGTLHTQGDYVGYSGTGIFNQLGGTITSTTLLLASSAGSCGTYNLQGGILKIEKLNSGSGSAAFNFGGGTLQARDSFSTSLPMAITGIGGNANVDTASYEVTLSGDLSGEGGLNKIGLGTLTRLSLIELRPRRSRLRFTRHHDITR